MKTKQLEIALEPKNTCPRVYRSRARRVRARWWFNQMRAVVESATDWKAAPRPTGEQTHLLPDSEKS
jgi:hypothetical protein